MQKSIPFMDKRFLFYTDVTSKVKLSVNKTYVKYCNLVIRVCTFRFYFAT